MRFCVDVRKVSVKPLCLRQSLRTDLIVGRILVLMASENEITVRYAVIGILDGEKNYQPNTL